MQSKDAVQRNLERLRGEHAKQQREYERFEARERLAAEVGAQCSLDYTCWFSIRCGVRPCVFYNK